ncbi:MAG: hypothetical protein A2076_16580 [Geobacteraceae bacterium GWC2_53_11]|nr:MAG: hypothetical protein A2076_16580 [Geobacteraceae bacterium GWC2_53_11]
MKTVAKIVVVMAAMVSISGCAGNGSAVIKAGVSTRQDVFREASDSTAIAGKALLKIDFPVKNTKARIATTYFKHSDPSYTVTINIDGQAIVLKDEPVLEDLPWDFKDNPEAGTGWKYAFKKELLLEPGKHHMTIAVPLSDVILVKDITLHAGTNILKVTPDYRTSGMRDRNYPKFNLGLNTLKLELNNQEL